MMGITKGLHNAAPLEILSAAHHTGYLILVPKGYLVFKPFVALHQITRVRVAHSEKMLRTTDLTCEVYRAVYRFAKHICHGSFYCRLLVWILTRIQNCH